MVLGGFFCIFASKILKHTGMIDFLDILAMEAIEDAHREQEREERREEELRENNYDYNSENDDDEEQDEDW